MSSSTGSSVSVGPSEKTLKSISIPERIRSFTRDALPWSEVSIPKDTQSLQFDPKQIRELLDVYSIEYRDKIYSFVAKEPLFKDRIYIGLSVAEQRQRVLDQLKCMRDNQIYRFKDVLEDPLKWCAFLESTALISPAVCTKTAVNFGLFATTAVLLGTEEQSKPLIEPVQKLEITGGFALTEMAHGSNARAIETIAVFDEKTNEFVLNTPNVGAQKHWIGNLACHANHLVVFAQVEANGKPRGVNAFICRIRDDNLKPLPGVKIADSGPKMGLNGVDNGRLFLENLRVPKTALLGKYAWINENGEYESPIASNNKRFAAIIGNLVTGRICTSQFAIQYCKIGLIVATRYALVRRQFGPDNDNPGNSEVVLLDYLSHQRKLFPLLAKTMALQFVLNSIKIPYYGSGFQNPMAYHILASGIKPLATWHKVECLQICRESMGGNGFHAAAKIGIFKTESDIDVNWEGDNTVLLQQVSSALLKELRTQMKAGGNFYGILSYLGRQWGLELRDKNWYKKYYRHQDHLMDFAFFRHCLEYREAGLLRSLVDKLKRLSKHSVFDSWNLCEDIVSELAKASMDRQILETFIENVEKCEGDLRIVLHLLCSLYALHTIEKNLGWFMTVGYFSSSKARAIWDEIGRLCGLLRPHARSLIDSFGIPDDVCFIIL